MTAAQPPTPVTIHRHRGRNQCFDQDLGDGLWLRMMQIPGGRFVMGAPAGELERQDREGPQHSVSLPAFFLGKYPVTQAQWRQVAQLELVNLRLRPSPSGFQGDNRPVEQVSWFEAVEFCQRLSRQSGRTYRLPTEAEWEYACRAGTSTPFHFGETITTDLANYNGADAGKGRYGPGPGGVYRQATTAVGHFEVANAFGLYDMHGNVWEWCQDPWRVSYAENQVSLEAGEGPSSALSAENSSRRMRSEQRQDQSTHQVARGGSWYCLPQRCRAASRFHFQPQTAHSDLGFRVVCLAL